MKRTTMTERLACAWLHPNFFIGAILTFLLVAMATLSVFWTPFPANVQDIANRLQGSNSIHWLGTDTYGRDIASRLMVGARNSIAVGLVAVGIGISVGVVLGAWAAARGGWLDELIMRAGDIVFAFPAILSAILITAYLGPGAVNVIIAIGIFNIPVFARVTRGAALQIWGFEYTRAAIAIGKGAVRVTLDHVLPNIAPVLIVQATIQFAVAILAEAALSYLGLGATPPNPSWGRMLFDAQTMMGFAPTLAIYPGLAIALTVLGLNMLGDGLRDLLDPRLNLWRMA